MLPTAHVATALAVNRLAGFRAGNAPAILGALVPDMIDKTLSWVLRITPTARHIAHTPLSVGVLSLGASKLMGARWGRAFATAYTVHLLGDLWHGGRIPWLLPFKRYDWRAKPWHVDFSPDLLVLEALGAAAIVVLLRLPDPTDEGPATLSS
ncbi:MAG: metal-dependent hydrolase [Dehalococcoidia bacterium]